MLLIENHPQDSRCTVVDRCPTIAARYGTGGCNVPFVLDDEAVTDSDGTTPTENRVIRRLTVRECERLQGFPDDYTLVPYRGKPATDTPRYKAIGNSMAVPCMRWIGEGIAGVQEVLDTIAQERCDDPRG